MQIQVSRLSVLYEDLRIEWHGAQQDELKPLDHTSIDTRRFYFVRRTLATLAEIGQAINKLNANKEFQSVKKLMQPNEIKRWNEAVKFFAKGHKFLKEWRNDIGGHFLDEAAAYAIDNVQTVGTIELYRSGAGADVKMPFAYELVAVAMAKNKGAETEHQFLEKAFTFLKNAALLAIDAIQIVTNVYLFDRFK